MSAADDPPTTFRVLKKRKPAEKTLSQSTWFFTLSYNRKEEDLNEEQKRWFEDLVVRLFSRPYVLLKTAPRCTDYVSTAFYHVKPELIERCEAEVAFESGELRGVYHAHGRVNVIHRTRVQLNLAAIQNILREEAERHDPGGPGLFFRATWTRGSEEARISNYLQKPSTKIHAFSGSSAEGK